MSTNKYLLFICHESSRTGAPIFLLYFIRWIKKNTDQKFIILIDKGGDLDEEFQNLGLTYILHPRPQSLYKKIWTKISYRSYIKHRLESLLNYQFGIIYNNTMTNGILVALLKEKTRAYVITHVHELENVIQSRGDKIIQLIKKSTDHYLAASTAVKNNLIQNHNIKNKDISIHYECIEFIPETLNNEELRIPFTYNKSDFIIGGAGFVDYRKGFDIFLETAKKSIIENNHTDLKFIWIGGFGRNIKRKVDSYIREHNLIDHVFFLGEKKNPFPYFQLFDIFFLTSREDPFPLVMLENASLGKPTIGFRGTGGFEEFIDYDSELLVDSFDIQQAMDKIIKLKKDKISVATIGEKLKGNIKENYLMGIKGRRYFDHIWQLAGLNE